MPGFTLTELLAALAIAAVLALFAAPGFAGYLRDLRQGATLNLLAHAVHVARAMGGAAGLPVAVCGSAEGLRCAASGDWSAGILVRALGDRPTSPPRYMPFAPARGGLTVRSNRQVIEFRPLEHFATPATVTVCDDRGGAKARALIISRTGRARLSDRDASGRLLRCP